MQRVTLLINGQEFVTTVADEESAAAITEELQVGLTADHIVDVELSDEVDGQLVARGTLSVVAGNITTLLIRTEPLPPSSGGAMGISR